MQAQWNDLWLTSASERMFGISVSGRSLVDEAHLVRALNACFDARNNKALDLRFSVHRTFADIATAEAFLLGHYGTMLSSGTLRLRIGEAGSVAYEDVLLENTVLRDVQIGPQVGVSIVVTYAFSFAPPAMIAPVPSSDTYESGSVQIGNGDHSVSLTGAAWGSTPTMVLVTVRKPSDGMNIFATIVAGSLSQDGFNAELSASTDGSQYYLDYIALF